jgi:hypothetical protein
VLLAGSSLSTIFTLSAFDWTDDPEDLPLSYAFFQTQGPISEETLSPSLAAYLPVGDAARSNAVNLSLSVRDIYGSTTVVTQCNGQALACAVRVDPPPASDASTVVQLVETAATAALLPLVAARNIGASANVMGMLLSVLNQPALSATMRRGREFETMSAWPAAEPGHRGRDHEHIMGASSVSLKAIQPVQARLEELRTLMVSSLSALVSQASLTEDQAVLLSSIILGTVQEYDQITVSSQGALLSLCKNLTSALSENSRATGVTQLLLSLSYLHKAGQSTYARRVASAQACADLHAELLAATTALARKAIASSQPGQPGFNVTTPSFELLAIVLPAASAPGDLLSIGPPLFAPLEYHFAGARVRLEKLTVPASLVAAPPATTSPAGTTSSTQPSVDALVYVWPPAAQRFFDEGDANTQIAAATVQVSLYSHGHVGEVNVSALPEPLSLFDFELARQVPPRLNTTTGIYRRPTCVYLTSPDRANSSVWSNSGLSEATVSVSLGTRNRSNVSNAVWVTCMTKHLSTFSVQDAPVGCDNVTYSNKRLDQCRVCAGSNACLDCAGTPFGDKKVDPCGVCGGSNTVADCTGCDGKIYLPPSVAPVRDACGVCGGNGNDKGCDGKCFSGRGLDQCNVCGGDGSACEFLAPKFSGAVCRCGVSVWPMAAALCVWVIASFKYLYHDV